MLFHRLHLNALFEYTYCCSRQGWFTCDLPIRGTFCPKCAPLDVVDTRCFSVKPWIDQADISITDEQGFRITVSDHHAGISSCISFNLIELILMAKEDKPKHLPNSLFRFRIRDRHGFLSLVSSLRQNIEAQGMGLSDFLD